MNNEMHKAIKLLNTHSLSVVSVNRQIKNGTIMVMDDILGTKYTIHSNGYARKRVTGMYGQLNHYQLNKVKQVFGPGYIQGSYRTHTERILLPGKYVELAEMVIKKANRDRKNEAKKELKEQLDK